MLRVVIDVDELRLTGSFGAPEGMHASSPKLGTLPFDQFEDVLQSALVAPVQVSVHPAVALNV